MLKGDVSARNHYAAWREGKQTMIWRKAPRCPYCRSIEFRKVELLDLTGCMDKKAKNYQGYFVKADPARCRFK